MWLVVGITAIWILSGVVVYTLVEGWTNRGAFGEMFSAVNALFSGVALAGVIVAIVLQSRELELQRRELELTRDELRRTARAQEESRDALAKQVDTLERSVAEAGRMRSTQVLLRIYDIMQELRPRWHELYALPREVTSWTPEQKRLADHVGTELQRVAFLCEKGLVDSEFIMDNWGKVFVQCWDLLEPYIKDYRRQSGEPTNVEEGAIQRKHLLTLAKEM